LPRPGFKPTTYVSRAKCSIH